MMWWIYALLSALFASLTAIFAKLGVQQIQSDLATGIRTIIILILVWCIVLFKGAHKGIGDISKFSLGMLIISGIATGLSWLFYFKALQTGPVSQVAIVDKFSVALTVLLAFIFLQETITIKTILALMLIIGGTILLLSK